MTDNTIESLSTKHSYSFPAHDSFICYTLSKCNCTMMVFRHRQQLVNLILLGMLSASQRYPLLIELSQIEIPRTCIYLKSSFYCNTSGTGNIYCSTYSEFILILRIKCSRCSGSFLKLELKCNSFYTSIIQYIFAHCTYFDRVCCMSYADLHISIGHE